MSKGLMVKGIIKGKYILEQNIGGQGFSQIWRATNKQEESYQCALKFISYANRQEKYINREKQIYRKLNYQFIIRCQQTFQYVLQNINYLVIVMEYCSEGDIGTLFRSIQSLKEDIIVEYMIQMAEGIKYLHQQNIIHRNIKPENILINKNHEIRISDLGLARIVSSNKSRMTTSSTIPFYTSPQAYRHDKYGIQSDIWSLGLVYLELFLKRRLYLIWEERKLSSPPCLVNNFPEQQFKIFPIKEEVRIQLLEGMLKKDKDERLNIKKVLELLNKYKNQVQEKIKDTTNYDKFNFRICIKSLGIKKINNKQKHKYQIYHERRLKKLELQQKLWGTFALQILIKQDIIKLKVIYKKDSIRFQCSIKNRNKTFDATYTWEDFQGDIKDKLLSAYDFYQALYSHRSTIKIDYPSMDLEFVAKVKKINLQIKDLGFQLKDIIETRHQQSKKTTPIEELELKVSELLKYFPNDRKTADEVIKLGQQYQKVLKFKTALQNYKKAQYIYINFVGQAHLSYTNILQRIGNCYQNLHQNKQAIKNYEDASRIRQSIKTPDLVSYSYTLNQLGILYQKTGDLRLSRQRFELSIQVLKQNKYAATKAICLANFGNYYARINQNESSIEYFKQSVKQMQQVKQCHNSIMMLKVIGNLAEIYFKVGQYDQCFKQFAKVFEIVKSFKTKDILLEREYNQSVIVKIAYVYANFSNIKLNKIICKFLKNYLPHQKQLINEIQIKTTSIKETE